MAHLSPSIHPIIGGTEAYLVNLSSSLRELGISNEIIALCDVRKWKGSRHLKEKLLNGTPSKVWPTRPLGVLNKITARTMLMHLVPSNVGELKQHLEKFDLLHFHEAADLSFPITLQRVNKPKLLTCHTLNETAPIYRTNPTARRMLTRSANLFHVFSNYDRDELVHLGVDSGNIRIVPHGVNTHYFGPRRADAQEAPVRIVSLCRVERRKGLINLLMAARILKEQLPAGSFEVRIVGPVSEEAYYHELLEYKSQWHLEEVVFSGALPLDDRSVPSLLEGSSVFVLPSLQETFGIVNLEAMASGLPIVATRVGGVPEVVLDGETGFIVPPNDPEALAEKSAALIRDKKLREEMGRRGRRRVEELYSVERISRMVVDIYEELT